MLIVLLTLLTSLCDIGLCLVPMREIYAQT